MKEIVMGDFLNQIRGQGVYQIPRELAEHIQVRTKVNFNHHDAFLLTTALFSLSQEIKDIERPYSLIPKGVILLNDSEEFSYVADDALGYTLPLIVIYLGQAKERELNDLVILAIYLEEFFHHFLLIHDEEEVKKRVISRLNKTLTITVDFNDVYSEDWKSGYPDLYPDNE